MNTDNPLCIIILLSFLAMTTSQNVRVVGRFARYHSNDSNDSLDLWNENEDDWNVESSYPPSSNCKKSSHKTMTRTSQTDFTPKSNDHLECDRTTLSPNPANQVFVPFSNDFSPKSTPSPVEQFISTHSNEFPPTFVNPDASPNPSPLMNQIDSPKPSNIDLYVNSNAEDLVVDSPLYSNDFPPTYVNPNASPNPSPLINPIDSPKPSNIGFYDSSSSPLIESDNDAEDFSAYSPFSPVPGITIRPSLPPTKHFIFNPTKSPAFLISELPTVGPSMSKSSGNVAPSLSEKDSNSASISLTFPPLLLLPSTKYATPSSTINTALPSS